MQLNPDYFQLDTDSMVYLKSTMFLYIVIWHHLVLCLWLIFDWTQIDCVRGEEEKRLVKAFEQSTFVVVDVVYYDGSMIGIDKP